ncbi:MAG TPA: hypothetical protein VGQ13_03900 [Nitrososphaera sp.]|nr:hypothetical protein [Nitrososphaera sp.]
MWDVAGVGSILTKFMNRSHPESYCHLVQMRSSDPFGLTTNGEVWDLSPFIFAAKVLMLARRFDIIHVHAHDGIIDKLRLLYPRKIIIIHYHGTDIRHRWKDPEKLDVMKRVNGVIVSTRDLLDGAPPNTVYLPNPVDTDLFYPRGNPAKGKALHFSYNADKQAAEVCEKMNLELVIHDRSKNPVSHNMMPELLSKYEYYVDIKRKCPDDPILEQMSMTGLEALACGSKVVTWKGDIITNLPEEHRPENAANSLWTIYKNLVDK